MQDLREAVGQRRRSGLQDDRRFDLVEIAVAHRGHSLPARARRHRSRAGISCRTRNRRSRRASAAGLPSGSAMMRFLPSDSRASSGKQSSPPAISIELRDPADAGDLRLVPFLEIHARAPRRSRCGGGASLDARLELGDERRRLAPRSRPCRRACAIMRRISATLRWLNTCTSMPAAHQLGGDIRLQIREPEHEVGSQRHDPVDLRAGECGHPRLFLARARRPHGESRDADDARVLAEQIERLGGLFGETNDACA